ncbi:MAG: 2-succinyl-5-enolpyruvyl-6-hydroxy-3-cyclohexene-1-carboxylic-acid synthase, partial [Actinobacteria bacterium]|nr:2-succinyl-5-enolpyruvyl-6-hydroxy-3-cyclohexene-1-carboxylic-acid synthase [Actinomycetota bacterium]
RPGPVHLNWALREPLVLDEALPPDDTARSEGRPWLARPPVRAEPLAPVLEALDELVTAHPRGAILAGRHERADELPAAVAALARATGYPVFADPLSGARSGPAAIAHYDALLRHPGFAARHRPDLVIRVGDLPTSKALRAWLASLGQTPQLTFDTENAWQDPHGVLGALIASDPALTLRALAERVAGPRDPAWPQAWGDADRLAADAIAAALAGELSEPGVVAELAAALPAEATLVVSSSMPVRDVETFWPVRDDQPRLLSNRGANGIDGVVSTAFGVAAASAPAPVVALLGDVALAHDVGGLVAARRLELPLTIVVVDNGGGGIFDFLPVAGETDIFEEHVTTAPRLDIAGVAAAFGLRHAAAQDRADLAGALESARKEPRATIIEVRTQRRENVALHRRVWDAVAHSLEQGTAVSPPAPAEAPPA